MTRVLVSKKSALILSVLLLIALGAFLSLRGTGVRREAHEEGAPGASFLEGVKVISVQGDKVGWSLDSKQAELLQGGKEAKLDEVLMDVPEEGAHIEAPGGYFDIDTGKLRLTGDIKTDIKGYVLETGSVEVLPGGKINTPGKVLLKGKGVEIEGRGLETQDEKNVRLKSDVKARFKKL
jgi:hypothetical protein